MCTYVYMGGCLWHALSGRHWEFCVCLLLLRVLLLLGNGESEVSSELMDDGGRNAKKGKC